MSSDLVSQTFSGPPDGQLVQMDHVSSNPEAVAHMQSRIVGHVTNNSAAHQSVWSNEPMANRSDTSVFTNQLGQMGPKVNPQHFMLSHQQIGGDRYVPNSFSAQKSPLLTKRKAEMELKMEPKLEPMFHGSAPQLSSMSNKRTAQGAAFSTTPGFVQQSSAIKKPGHQQFKSASGVSNLPASSKKMARNDSISNKTGSQRSQTPKGRTIQVEPTSKAQSESSEAMRSKMRESLASALAMACQNQDAVVNAASNLSEAVNHQPAQVDVAPTTANETLPQASTSHEHVPGDVLPSTDVFPVDKPNDSQSSSHGLHDDMTMGNSILGSNELQWTTELHVDDVPFSENFFVKDELLQGNGLTWAMDLDMQVREAEFLQDAENDSLFDDGLVGDKDEQEKSSPQDLALKIEAELFKLFGGVNKKYREKGRSLLFNLKDRNNPELRERVMSGEIPPDKLCSMTAEELASKELSQWRMAKAEELAQMVVLPDTEVDMRRLVKKTHKGEYQVDFERDDNNIASEISAGSNVSQFMPKIEKKRNSSPSGTDENGNKENASSQPSSLEKQDASDGSVISTDGADLMQGMIGEEFKDAEFLPPIVSLDEFMESFNSEPPFERLPAQDKDSTPLPDKESSEDPAKVAAKDPAVSSADKAVGGIKDHVKPTESLISAGSTAVKKLTSTGNVPVRSAESIVKMTGPHGNASKVASIWEGSLQLTVSSLVTVFGLFRSGEKTPTNEWPSSLEIKGRVRLDAFEKFLQALPMSRSRAVMVVQFGLKDKSSESERANLSEAVDSYVSDERLGFAEPAPGVELYLCPPRILDMISKHLSKDPKELYDSTDNGLIGVVVWRKLHISSTISPNSSSHHKHSLKKQQMFPRGQHEKDGKVNVNLMPKGPMSSKHEPTPNDEDDGDIPPGFGPVAGRDDDDLPEFNFSGNINASRPSHVSQNLSQGPRMAPYNQPPLPSRAVDQMRELVQKYGQTGANTKPWNDDDDDIPEWQPQPPPLQQQQQLRPTYPVVPSYQQPYLAQHGLPPPLPMPLQPPINVPNRHQNLSPTGQYHTLQGPGDWRRNTPRGRGY